jgi:phage-related tail fiber protein
MAFLWLMLASMYPREAYIASLPPSYKPELAEGSGRLQAVIIWIAVSSTANVN